MAENLGTLSVFTESLSSDYLLVRKGDRDVKVKKEVLYKDVHPVGSVLVLATHLTPEELGYSGTWKIWVDGSGRLETNTVSGFSGSISGVFPLPQHTHTATVVPASDHSHDNLFTTYAETTSKIKNPSNQNVTNQINFTNTSTSLDGEHLHEATLGNTGTTNVSLDLEPRAMKIALWEKIS
jgi:hypothetical protein